MPATLDEGPEVAGQDDVGRGGSGVGMDGQTGCGTEGQPASWIDAGWSLYRGDDGGRGGCGAVTAEPGHGDCDTDGECGSRGDADERA